MSSSKFLMAIVICSTLLAAAAGAAPAAEPVKAVYHMNESGFEQAMRTINFVSNHLGADPSAKIVILAQADGVQFLAREARNDNGAGFGEAVAALQKKGVQFTACNLSLLSRGIRPDQLLPGIKIIPSGVAELARLQSSEQFAYIRP